MSDFSSNEYDTGNYNDDEEIKVQEFTKENTTVYDIDKKIHFNLSSLTKAIKLSSDKSQLVPV